MNFRKKIILEDKILFKILDEIKDKFNLEVILVDKKNFLDVIDKLKEDYLIISKAEKKDTKRNLVLNNFPIKVIKLMELINLKFLKERFNSRSDILIGPYKINLNSRKIIKDEKIVDLTEREINLILFLKKNPRAVKIDELQKEVWDYGAELETHTVETHIYRLRKKIKKEFNDQNFILSSGDGYLIE